MVATAERKSPSRSGRPLRSRYWLVVLLPLAAFAAVVPWFYSVDRAVSAETDRFARGGVPGAVALDAHPDTWYIYADSGSTVRSIRVFDPAGGTVAVVPSSAGSYQTGGMEVRAVGQFTLGPGQIGTYQVAVTGTQAEGAAFFTVGNFSVSGFVDPQLWSMVGLLAVNLASAAAIAIVPAVRARRRRREASTTGTA